MRQHPVFFDPSGRRKAVVSRLTWVALAVAAVVTTLFATSLVVLPALPVAQSARKHLSPPAMPKDDAKKARAAYRAERQRLLLAAREARARTVPARAATKIAAAFYAPWQQSGLQSFRAHAGQLTHVVPAWLTLGPAAGTLDYSDYDTESNPGNKDLAATARKNGVRIVPLVSNSVNGDFVPARAHAALVDKAVRDQLARDLVDWVVKNQYQGLNIDFELVPEADWAAYVDFLTTLHDLMTPKGLELSADLEATFTTEQAGQAADVCDWVALMLYDEHSETDEAGPIASEVWYDTELARFMTRLPEDKVVVAVGSYAYDWPKGSNKAASLTFEDAMATAAGFRDGEKPEDVVEIDPGSLNPRFNYEDDKGHEHVVWFLDAVTAYNETNQAQQLGLRGAALWVLGSEDPALWSFYDSRKMAAKPDRSGLDTIKFPYEVDFVGKGEMLRVKARPQTGSRQVEFDPDTGDAVDWEYLGYAFPYVLEKSGYKPKKLVLTFDDGPDAQYTPQVLDELKRLGVPATFFVVGQNAVENPDLVRRMLDEGHEVGSHSFSHPNLGAISRQRAELEINATQRAIEAVTGRSTRLFRPPYNADSEPQTVEQVTPVEIADGLDYITVGENIDPHDWDLNLREDDGTTRRKTAEDIADSVVRDIEKRAGTNDEGNVILLHDAGGDRSATVKALGMLVPRLQAMGYTFTTVADLVDLPRDKAMPPLSGKDSPLVGVDRTVFFVTLWAERILTVTFLVAIGLGLARSLFVTGLALVAHRRVSDAVAGTPSVSCLVAAYNEEVGIVGTVRPLLASDYPVTEVVVVDDGSTDATATAVAEAFADEPRVRLVRQANGGKASALNTAIGEAAGELLFCVDADTHVDPSAVGLLVRHFADASVVAAAGRVMVGNNDRFLTRMQSLEYTTSQNVDREAHALLNCVTVVPGAIGMWRKSAIQAVGGYETDTLAEDTDLTWRLRKAGGKIANEAEALSWTEAPATVKSFFKQRFRWAFGTLQCLVKHRRTFLREGWFGWYALPSVTLFQFVFQVLAPLIDLKLLWTAAVLVTSLAAPSQEMRDSTAAAEQMVTVATLYGLFFLVELLASWVAYRWDKGRRGELWYLFLQRFVYRQLLYMVVIRAVWRAVAGARQGWGTQQRQGISVTGK